MPLSSPSAGAEQKGLAPAMSQESFVLSLWGLGILLQPYPVP